jgi:hypothetical protein
MRIHSLLTWAIALWLPFGGGCGHDHDHPHGAEAGHTHDGDDGHTHDHPHGHEPQHGGFLVALEEEFANVELLHDAEAGTLDLWALDAHAEGHERLKQPTVVVSVDAAGGAFDVTLAAVASALTGETVGDTSRFQGQDARLVGLTALAGRIGPIESRGQQFPSTPFSASTAP